MDIELTAEKILADAQRTAAPGSLWHPETIKRNRQLLKEIDQKLLEGSKEYDDLMDEHSSQRKEASVEKKEEKVQLDSGSHSNPNKSVNASKSPSLDAELLSLWRINQLDWQGQDKQKQTKMIKAFRKWKNKLRSEVEKDFEQKIQEQKRKIHAQKRKFQQEIFQIKREFFDFVASCSCQEPPRKKQRQNTTFR